MNKRKAYRLVFTRGLKKTKSRFLSIFFIVFLGASFFAGLRNAPITMNHSMNNYLREHHFADLTLISSFGFTNADIEKVQLLEGVLEAEGAYRSDVLLTQQDLKKEIEIVAHGQSKNFHSPEIVEGRDIENPGECLVDWQLKDLDLLNKEITIKNDQGSTTLKVVGIVNDSRYISDIQRGTNTLTNATNSGFLITTNEDLKSIATIEELQTLRDETLLYNEILVSYKDTQNIGFFDVDYDNQTRVIKANISDMVQNDLTKIKESIVERFENELATPLKEYEEGLAEYLHNKDESTHLLNEGKIELMNGKLEIIENKKKLLEAQSTLNQETGNISSQLDLLNQQINRLKEEINAIPDTDIILPDFPPVDGEITPNPSDTIQNIKDKVNEMTLELDETMGGLQMLIDANVELNRLNYELEGASLEVQKAEAELENLTIETNKQLDEAKVQLDDAKVQIDEAKQQIKDIPDGVLYSLTRNENAGIMSFSNDSHAIDSLSKIFPLMFFLVAALVSLTTMTRMVEEQRLQSGTLTALGYSKKDVMMLYIRYALLSTLLASLLGIVFGTLFFTNIIYYLYCSLMYQVGASVVLSFTPHIVPLTLAISVGITLAVTMFVVYQELNSTPATLLRPKPPKLGKRIYLERVTFIWKRLSFNQKVAIRNIFRYKKRFFMSIAGIAGCCALIVTGFGIKNSIKQIVPLQFSQIWSYDGGISLNDKHNQEDIKPVLTHVKSQYNVSDALALYEGASVFTSSQHQKDLNGTLRVMENRNSPLIHFYNASMNEFGLEDEGVILSKKTSELLNVSIDQQMSLTINGTIHQVNVTGICENYYGHYVYMSKSMYESLSNEKLMFNQVLFSMKDDNVELESSLEEVLKKHEQVRSVTFMSSTFENFNTMIKSLDIVVVIIIGSAALLAFIVLYNLTNINIQERMNEIATIKVLGFYPKEVYDYVFRENIFLALIGSSVGLVFGVVLHQYVIRTVEIDQTMFYRQLDTMSYVFAFILTMLFTMIINRIMRRNLDQIDMIESLKSVE